MAALNITNLDFEGIKQSIKEYLRTTSDFKDFDFDGSNLSTLIDILAYNTYYNGYYLHMVANEMFLDTAVLKESVLARAKELNYVPRSAVSARAVVNLSIQATSGTPATIEVPKGTLFTTSVNGQTFTFSTMDNYQALPVGGNYVVNDVEICEGDRMSYTYDPHNVNDPEKYVIPNDNVDITSLEVKVQTSTDDLSTTTFTRATSIIDITEESNVYFVEPYTGNQYRVVFGDGVLGKALRGGNIVVVDYTITNGTESNGADAFTYSEGIPGAGSVSVTTTSNAAGGLFEESVESIRFNAPRSYSAQERAVTATDYATLIGQQFPHFKSIRAYGGEEETPPQFGKVFVAIRPQAGEVLSQSERNRVITFLKGRSVVGISTEIKDPNYIYIKVDYDFAYDPNKTSRTGGAITDIVQQEITKFSDQDLGKFNTKLRSSRLLRRLEEQDQSILSSTVDFSMIKRLSPRLRVKNSFNINFNNAIYNPDPGHEAHVGHSSVVTSSFFTISGRTVRLVDDGSGNLTVQATKEDGTTEIINRDAGTVDYGTGQVVINKLQIDDIANGFLSIHAKPAKDDIVPATNQILLIDDKDVSVSYTVEQE